MTKHHYVYRSFEEGGRDYIGIRSCKCLPEEDIEYFGSFHDETFKPIGKVILFVCETRQEVAEIEIELHDFFDVAVNPQFANKAKQTSTKFDTTGVPKTEEAKKKLSVANSGKTHTEETKKKLSVANSGKTHTEEHKKKISVANSGRTLTEETKKKMSKAMSGENNPLHGRTGALHHSSKAIIVIKPDGTQRHFGSGHEAARELGIDQGNLCGLYLKTGHALRRGQFKGWQFLFKNSENF